MATATQDSVRAELPSATRELIHAFEERKLMTWASALAFHVVRSLVPFLLFGLALLGFLQLDSAWADIAKNIKPHMSKAAFEVVDTTAKKVLGEKQLFWMTIGLGLALWQMSAGIRTIMGGLCLIYEAEECRSWPERMRRSLLLAAAVSTLVILAAGAIWLGPLIYGDVGQPVGAFLFLIRWSIAAVLLALAVGLTVRYAPDGYQPAGWATVGTGIVVGAWIAASLLFGLYIRYVAAYGSVFGNLATIVILFIYVYISAIVFFAGAQVDAIIRRRVEGNARGQ